jgi:gamma-glutamylcyclotransferase (GGCT)/AIG2-like uncharacterized protein YtfP
MFTHFFVYGTLKRGQCRERCWPLSPQSVRVAWTYGELYDTGPYPAMFRGTDRVLGELWSFPSIDADIVFEVLDQIEGTNQGTTRNEYDRELVDVFLLETPVEPHEALLANVYIFARPELIPTFKRVKPSRLIDGRPVSEWPEFQSHQ